MAYPAEVFGIVSALYWLHTDKVYGSEQDSQNLTALMAEQVSHELDQSWGHQGQILTFLDGDKSYGLKWRAPDGELLFPLERVEIKVEHSFAVEPTDHLDMQDWETEDKLLMLKGTVKGMLMVIKMTGTIYASIDDMKKELAELKRRQNQSYTARLNFKQVTFHPVDRD